jgi:hypothetical protein
LEEESIKSVGTEERKVIFASRWARFSNGMTLSVRDLAPFFAALFFRPGNDTAALLSAFVTYAAGFLVRPFGAIVFGRSVISGSEVHLPGHDRTMVVPRSGHSLPTFKTTHWAAPVCSCCFGWCRAPGTRRRVRRRGDYVAEHAAR